MESHLLHNELRTKVEPSQAHTTQDCASDESASGDDRPFVTIPHLLSLIEMETAGVAYSSKDIDGSEKQVELSQHFRILDKHPAQKVSPC